MPDEAEYIRKSMELNLFFLRIMKEHALFIQLAFTPKNAKLAAEAAVLRKKIADLMQRVVVYSRGYVNPAVIASGELFTRYTLGAEQLTQLYTDVPPQIDLELTEDEYDLTGPGGPEAEMRYEVEQENKQALELMKELIQFKKKVREDVLSCRVFTLNYSLMIDHMIREALFYVDMLKQLMSNTKANPIAIAQNAEVFWDQIMMEHAEFIDGLLDPSETALKQTAKGFAKQYAALEAQALDSQNALQPLSTTTMQSRNVTQSFQNFNAQATQGILQCKIRSVIIPLMADHVLREANYYIRLLNEASAGNRT